MRRPARAHPDCRWILTLIVAAHTVLQGVEPGLLVARLVRPDGSFRAWWHIAFGRKGMATMSNSTSRAARLTPSVTRWRWPWSAGASGEPTAPPRSGTSQSPTESWMKPPCFTRHSPTKPLPPSGGSAGSTAQPPPAPYLKRAERHSHGASFAPASRPRSKAAGYSWLTASGALNCSYDQAGNVVLEQPEQINHSEQRVRPPVRHRRPRRRRGSRERSRRGKVLDLRRVKGSRSERLSSRPAGLGWRRLQQKRQTPL